jgi:hypothetical protein
MGLRPDQDAKALRMGHAWHLGLDALKNGSCGLAREVLAELYGVCPDHIDSLRWEYELWTLLGLINGYTWRWENAPLDVVSSEHSFVRSLINPTTGAASKIFSLAGKIDGIVQLEDGRLAVLEHKTTSEDLTSDSDFWRRLQIDSQVSIYVTAARRCGYDVATVVYDVVRKPSIRPTDLPLLDDDGQKIVFDENGQRAFKKDGKPYQAANKTKGWVLQVRPMASVEWGQKLVDDIAERPDWYFARREIPRLDEELTECQAELWELQKTIRDAQRNNRWYRTVSHDTCSYCPYWGPCSSKLALDPLSPPEGFFYTDNVHPELELQKEPVT